MIDQCLHFTVDAAEMGVYTGIFLVFVLLAMDYLLIQLWMLVLMWVAILLELLEAMIVVPDKVALHIEALRAD